MTKRFEVFFNGQTLGTFPTKQKAMEALRTKLNEVTDQTPSVAFEVVDNRQHKIVKARVQNPACKVH